MTPQTTSLMYCRPVSMHVMLLRCSQWGRRNDEMILGAESGLQVASIAWPPTVCDCTTTMYVLVTALLQWTSEYAVRAYTTADSAVSYLNHAQIASTTPSFALRLTTAAESCENGSSASWVWFFVSNTPFTRWSWLDELARRALDELVEPASSCKRGISCTALQNIAVSLSL